MFLPLATPTTQSEIMLCFRISVDINWCGSAATWS